MTTDKILTEIEEVREQIDLLALQLDRALDEVEKDAECGCETYQVAAKALKDLSMLFKAVDIQTTKVLDAVKAKHEGGGCHGME